MEVDSRPEASGRTGRTVPAHIRRRMNLQQFHSRERLSPMLWFLVPMAIWVATLGGCLVTNSLLAGLAFSAVGGLAGCQLFVIAHDACHGSLTSSRLLNAIVGRLAFVPGLHNYSLWGHFHNGLHHHYTSLRGRDFVWTPFSPDEFRCLRAPRRFIERVYRHPTGAGFGLYYAIELWRRKLLLPWNGVPRGVVLPAYLDAAGLAAAWSLIIALMTFVFGVDIWKVLGRLALFAGLTFMMISWAIGFVVFFNHTHPRLRWYASAALWRKDFSQARGACHVTFGGIWWYLLPSVVMNHSLHHIDTLIPARRLKAAEAHYESCTGTRLVSWRWTLLRHYAIVKLCGLYDYRAGRWMRLDALPEESRGRYRPMASDENQQSS